MVAASRENGESAPLLATSNRGGDASASASDSEATPRGARSRNGPGGVVAVCFSVSMIFAGFMVSAYHCHTNKLALSAGHRSKADTFHTGDIL